MNTSIPYIDAHTHQFLSDESRICFHTYRHGIHPWLVQRLLDGAQLNDLRQNPPTYFGEVGIDRRRPVDPELQRALFCQYLNLAKELHLPLIVHAVGAENDIAQCLKHTPYSKVLIHGFHGNTSQAKILLTQGCYLSIGAALIKSHKLQDALTTIPLEKLFFETDDQKDVAIELIYQCASTILEITLDELKAKIFDNAIAFFGDTDDWKKMD